MDWILRMGKVFVEKTIHGFGMGAGMGVAFALVRPKE
jgi:hypothetical protein